MPNQLNYPERLTNVATQRPGRLSSKDAGLLRSVSKEIIFGTSDRDVVELWVYTPDGNISAHRNIGPVDTALTATTIIDSTGPHELLNLDMTKVVNSLELDPGRYVMVANFFRNEVGAEAGYKLYISEISDDRTELRLEPLELSDVALHDLYEFATPGVPREFAQGLMAEILAQSVDGHDAERVTPTNVAQAFGDSDVNARIDYASVRNVFDAMVRELIIRTYRIALTNMAIDSRNFYVQRLEIEDYIERAVTSAIGDMINQGVIDARFDLI